MPIQKVNGLYKSMSPIMDKEKMSKIESDVLNLIQGITMLDSILILENNNVYSSAIYSPKSCFIL
jgi:hypothetical protein